MATKRQQQTPIKNVGGRQILPSDEVERAGDPRSPAQREALRRAGEPAVELGPEESILRDEDPQRRISANKRGGGSHGGSDPGR